MMTEVCATVHYVLNIISKFTKCYIPHCTVHCIVKICGIATEHRWIVETLGGLIKVFTDSSTEPSCAEGIFLRSATRSCSVRLWSDYFHSSTDWMANLTATWHLANRI